MPPSFRGGLEEAIPAHPCLSLCISIQPRYKVFALLRVIQSGIVPRWAISYTYATGCMQVSENKRSRQLVNRGNPLLHLCF